MVKARVYISAPLTNADSEDMDSKDIEHMRRFYEAIAEVCEEKGCSAYVPHRYTDPATNSSIPPRDVYEIDMQEVSKADLVLAYVGIASHGVGMEIERAYHEGKKVVLLYKQGAKVSRLPRGCPAVVAEVQFAEQKDALRQIALLLENTLLPGGR